MRKVGFVLFVMMLSFFSCIALSKGNVEFKSNESENKVDVYIDGTLFTSYVYSNDLKKPVLYPIFTPSGKFVTRGYPIDPRPFESVDHPHHIGLWFNFGDVNGVDFWNNSPAVKPADQSKYGTIKLEKLLSLNNKTGELIASSNWEDSSGNVLLNEETIFKFSGEQNLRVIERTTKLTALEEVTFSETKEGMLGLRIDRAFEEPSSKPMKLLDKNGVENDNPVLNNEGVNGVYRNADGLTGGDVWSTRTPWVALRASKDNEIITLVIIDNKENENYPGWSHARGYGLFGINNLGGRDFDKNANPVKKVLMPGEQIAFKHMIVIGGDLTDSEINAMSKSFK